MDNKPVPRRQLPMVLQVPLLLLLGVICGFMVLAGLIGLCCVVLGLISLGVDLSGTLTIQLAGAEVRTTTQKLLFTALGAVMALAGVGFVWLARRDHLGRALILWALFLGGFALIGWLTGNTQIVSVGG
jgi:hypothetical protein